MDINIAVFSCKNSICNLEKHFTENWINSEGLHPLAKKCEVSIDRDALVDAIYVNDAEEGGLLFCLLDEKALRLDLLQEKVIDLQS